MKNENIYKIIAMLLIIGIIVFLFIFVNNLHTTHKEIHEYKYVITAPNVSFFRGKHKLKYFNTGHVKIKTKNTQSEGYWFVTLYVVGGYR